jgi:hypothetical protein
VRARDRGPEVPLGLVRGRPVYCVELAGARLPELTRLGSDDERDGGSRGSTLIPAVPRLLQPARTALPSPDTGVGNSREFTVRFACAGWAAEHIAGLHMLRPDAHADKPAAQSAQDRCALQQPGRPRKAPWPQAAWTICDAAPSAWTAALARLFRLYVGHPEGIFHTSEKSPYAPMWPEGVSVPQAVSALSRLGSANRRNVAS